MLQDSSVYDYTVDENYLQEFYEWYVQNRFEPTQPKQQIYSLKQAIQLEQQMSPNIKPAELDETIITKLNWQLIKDLANEATLEPQKNIILEWCQQECVSVKFITEYNNGIADHGQHYKNRNPVITEQMIKHHIACNHVEEIPDETNTDLVRCIQPIFVLQKPGQEKYRLVYNAQWANTLMHAEHFVLPSVQQPVVDDFTYAAKIDLTEAFLAWNVDNQLARHQCFRSPTTNKLYRWKVAIWGTNVAPYIQQVMSEMIVNVVKKRFPQAKAYVYLDDFLVTSHSYTECQEALDLLRELITKVGLTISEKKSDLHPRKEIDYLGFRISRDTIKLIPAKVSQMNQLYKKVMSEAIFLDLHTLLAQLQSISTVIVGLRALAQQLIAQLPVVLINMSYQKKMRMRVTLKDDFRIALRHAMKLVLEPNISFRLQLSKTTYNVATDASLTHAGIANPDGSAKYSLYYKGELAEQLGIKKDLPIYKLELYAVVCAIKKAPRNSCIRVLMDNQTVIMGIPKGGASDGQYMNIIAKLNSVAVRRNITVVLHYINTEVNPADEPSRTEMPDFMWQPKENKLQVYQVTHLHQVSREEYAQYWFKQHQLILPKPDTKMWMLKMLSTNKKSLSRFIEHVEDAVQDWPYVPAEIRQTIANQFVYWSHVAQPQQLSATMQRLALLMESDGWIRQATISNAAKQKLKYLLNDSMIHGIRAALKSDEITVPPAPLLKDAQGLPVIQMSTEHVPYRTSTHKLHCFDQYWRRNNDLVPKSLRYSGQIKEGSLESRPLIKEKRSEGISLLEDRSKEYQDEPNHKPQELVARSDDEHQQSQGSTEDESISSFSGDDLSHQQLTSPKVLINTKLKKLNIQSNTCEDYEEIRKERRMKQYRRKKAELSTGKCLKDKSSFAKAPKPHSKKTQVN